MYIYRRHVYNLNVSESRYLQDQRHWQDLLDLQNISFMFQELFNSMLLKLFQNITWIIKKKIFLYSSPCMKTLEESAHHDLHTSDLICDYIMWPHLSLYHMTSSVTISCDLMCNYFIWPYLWLYHVTLSVSISYDLICDYIMWPHLYLFHVTSSEIISCDLICKYIIWPYLWPLSCDLIYNYFMWHYLWLYHVTNECDIVTIDWYLIVVLF